MVGAGLHDPEMKVTVMFSSFNRARNLLLSSGVTWTSPSNSTYDSPISSSVSAANPASGFGCSGEGIIEGSSSVSSANADGFDGAVEVWSVLDEAGSDASKVEQKTRKRLGRVHNLRTSML